MAGRGTPRKVVEAQAVDNSFGVLSVRGGVGLTSG
jgi:hypothetical protein